jgi:hypothetical protein
MPARDAHVTGEPPPIVVVEPAGLLITPQTYRTHEQHREIADRVMGALGLDPANVAQMRFTEARICVDVLNRRAGSEPRIRTLRYDLQGRPARA